MDLEFAPPPSRTHTRQVLLQGSAGGSGASFSDAFSLVGGGSASSFSQGLAGGPATARGSASFSGPAGVAGSGALMGGGCSAASFSVGANGASFGAGGGCNMLAPRALCISGGPGSGKSAVCAALVRQLGGAQGELSAYHFYRCRDTRRVDPVRVVKSLAYQLAAR